PTSGPCSAVSRRRRWCCGGVATAMCAAAMRRMSRSGFLTRGWSSSTATKALAVHDSTIEQHVNGWRGDVVKFTGDGVLATFDGPARAIECACAIRDAVEDIGLEIRAGLHTGEVEKSDGDV